MTDRARERARAARRILDVQRQLHRMEQLKFAQLEQKLAKIRHEQLALTEALSEDGALHGLFVDMTVRRLMALQQEESRLVPVRQAQAQRLIEHGGRVRNAEHLKDELDLELWRADERKELEEILEVGLGRSDASLKQDR